MGDGSFSPSASLAAEPSFLYPAFALSAGRDKSESVANNTDGRWEGIHLFATGTQPRINF
jgi:hypothetical protein